MILIPRGEPHGKMTAGRWRPMTRDGKFTASLSCPKCGDQGALWEHQIAIDGAVTPSVMCGACDYHESGLQLEGWPEAYGEHVKAMTDKIVADARPDPNLLNKPMNI